MDQSSENLRRKRTTGQEEGDDDGVGGRRETSGLESCLDQLMDSSRVYEVVKYTSSSLPAEHYDADTTEPVTCGLQTLQELLSWQKSRANPFNVAAVKLAARQPPLTDCPRRTLVSHDMMGGYLDDRFLQGTESEAPYAFYHWQYIDIFNYFAHKLVTIPPAVWTNAAHRHGVVVLGTFITEWTEGAKVCEAFLKDEESYRTVADKLVQISHHYGFDGWLVNIENTLSGEAVRNVPLFLRYLTDQTHERLPGGQVLWYDSVLEDGQLKWQNELNKDNRVFFDACDGFFTNYNWTEEGLEAMKTSGAVQGRQADIYVGVDVFARGEVVGGMFDTNKALELIRKHDFSAAIFAPGWVYESIDDKAEFRQNQDKFWALLADFLYIHRPTALLPFTSSFCQGFGKALYWRGEKQKEKKSWFNLSAQELQPLYFKKELESQGWLRSRGCSEEAWNGGSSLLLEGILPASHSKVCARIFSLHVPLASETLVALVYKPSAGIKVSLELETTDASQCTDKASSLSPLDLDDSHQMVRKLTQICGQWNPNGWLLRCTQLALRGCALREVCVSLQREGEPRDTPFSCRVGEIMVLDTSGLRVPAETICDLCVYDVVWLRVSSHLHLNATLRWRYSARPTRHFRVYWRRLRGPDPGTLELVGRAYSTLFRVTELEVPEPPGLLELVVEPVLSEGYLVPDGQWGRSSLSYTEEQTAT